MPSFLAALREKFRFGEFARNVATVATGTVVAQVILAVSALALARLYDKAAIGLLSTYMAIGAIVALAVTGRYDQAIVLPKDDRDALDLARLSLTLAAAGTFAFLVVVVLSYQTLAAKLQTPMMEGWFFVLIVSTFLNASRTTLSALLNRWKRYKGLAKSRMWHASVDVGLKLSLFPFEQTGLLLGAIGGQFAGIGILLKQAKRDIPGEHPFLWRNLWRVGRVYANFPRYMMPSALTDNVAMYLPMLGASFYFSPALAGEMMLAMGLLCLPAAVIGSAIAQVFYQECSVCVRENRFQEVRDLLFRTWTRLFFAALVPMGAIYFYGPEIFGFVLGEKWTQAGAYAAILVPLFLSDLIRSPTASTFLTLGLQRTAFGFSLATLAARGFGLFVALHMPAYSRDLPAGAFDYAYAYGISLTVIIEIVLMALFNARILFELRRRRIAASGTAANLAQAAS